MLPQVPVVRRRTSVLLHRRFLGLLRDALILLVLFLLVDRYQGVAEERIRYPWQQGLWPTHASVRTHACTRARTDKNARTIIGS